MPATYEPIATTTLGSLATTITFSTIPATYTDLRVVLTGSFDTTARPGLQLNGSSSTLYSQTDLTGNGSSAASARYSNQTAIFTALNNTLTNSMFLFTVDLFSYAGSTNKTMLITFNNDNNSVDGSIENLVALFRSTSAITSLTLVRTAGNYNIGTTATLYGILKA